MAIKEKQLLLETLDTLMFSWGGDTPPEAIWAGNSLLKWIEKEFNVKINTELEENEESSESYDKVVLSIKSL